jgi:hypothetical protein
MANFPSQPLSGEAQKLVLEVTKQLITLSVVALGFLTSMLFTSFKGTPFIPSAMTCLLSFLLSATFAVLAQLSIVAEVIEPPESIRVSYPRVLLHLSWIAFVSGLVWFVVFAWANLNNRA